MSGLVKGLMDFANELKTKSNALLTLTQDMESMKNGLKNNKPYSRKTVEPMTRLRKSEADLKRAKDKPDEKFIEDRINDILGIETKIE